MFSSCTRKSFVATPLFSLVACVLAVPMAAQSPVPRRQPVLLISIDGMRPDYVTHADEHHLRLPALRAMLAQGAHAEGVQGVVPTMTYPSHTTLVTGVWPQEHGILNNARFDPEHELNGAWYWYADQILSPTLWSAAHAAGLHTASVSWPVTVGSSVIDTLVPEYWRSTNAGDANNPDDRLLINALSRPDGELARIARRTGVPYMMGNATSLAGDEARTLYSLDILKQHRPEFMTIHLSSLDQVEHMHGPFSAEADSELEALDEMVGRLAAQERANFPNAIVAVVSDHGFADAQHATNLTIPFLQEGLIEGTVTGGDLDIQSWTAQPWVAGGMAAILLQDTQDSATRDKVRKLLARLQADPTNGIEAVLDGAEIGETGGFPNAAFIVTLKPGYYAGVAVTGSVASGGDEPGMHGYNPATHPEMRASFFITGQGIAQGKDLGVIDMRQIAPTLASLLGVSLLTAKQNELAIR